MNFTEKQIAIAKSRYNAFLQYRTVESFDPEYVGWNTAEQRERHHNSIVREIKSGNKELEKEWKMFFLREVVREERKMAESKAKIQANKEASADILAPIKELRKLGEFGKWLNTAGNKFRKEHFSKKYTQESINAFLETL